MDDPAFYLGYQAGRNGESFYANPFGLEKPSDDTRKWVDGMVQAIIEEKLASNDHANN
jgi:ribosome modulation factor